MSPTSDPLRARFRTGEVVGHKPYSAGPGQTSSTYLVESSDGTRYAFDYSDLLTEGFRTIEIGERVRFVGREEAGALRARYVVKLDDDLSELFYAS